MIGLYTKIFIQTHDYKGFKKFRAFGRTTLFIESCEEGFVPLASELFMSQTKAIALQEPCQEHRVIAYESGSQSNWCHFDQSHVGHVRWSQNCQAADGSRIKHLFRLSLAANG